MILGRTPLTTSRFVPQIVNVFFFGLLNVHVVFRIPGAFAAECIK